MKRAEALGYSPSDPNWINLGQGAPETSEFPSEVSRLQSISVSHETMEYSPVAGPKSLRQAVADLYNTRYRDGAKSQYTWENVAIANGGRAALTRVAASLANVNLGHFLPDYTAYEELLSLFRGFVSIPISLSQENGFKPEHEQLRKEIVGKGLGAVLISNPCNPTGQVLFGSELESWVKTSREQNCALIFDEFYSHYVFGEAAANGPISATRFVEDVNRDPVVVLDGLTKNWRYPGLRLAWTLAPNHVIASIESAGSFLDGGPSHPVSLAAQDLLNPANAARQVDSIQKHFSPKRKLTVSRLHAMNLRLESDPLGSFYAFPSLPQGHRFSSAKELFEACLKAKVIIVPGEFFDVDLETAAGTDLVGWTPTFELATGHR